MGSVLDRMEEASSWHSVEMKTLSTEHCRWLERMVVDPRGMGIRNKIIPLLREQNGTEPEFITTEDYLRLDMYIEQPNT